MSIAVGASWAAQSAGSDTASLAASSAYDAKDWAKAAELYESMAKEHPEIPRLWFRLANSQREMGKLDVALQTLEQGLKVGVQPVFAEYLIGSIYAQKGERDKALEHLQKALDAGYNQPDQFDSDEHLAVLRGDARFAKMRAQADHNLKPCATTPENRQFDFWLGEWDVQTTAGGVPAGQSKIELILGDCVVQENWQSNGNPYAGKSYNMYNPALKRWEQYWVDNSAGNIFFYGGLKDGVMDYWTDEVPQPSGPALKRHLQFIKLAPDKVRQYSQGSTDGGKTWKPEYDFTYVRKK
jgi:tetratricopeptide (TPR) repeat protein